MTNWKGQKDKKRHCLSFFYLRLLIISLVPSRFSLSFCPFQFVIVLSESENYLAISRSSSAPKSVKIFWARIYRGRLCLGTNLVSFNRTVVPYEILKVNFRIEIKFLFRINKLKKYQYQKNKLTKWLLLHLLSFFFCHCIVCPSI
jgi:hypothetical protein